MIPFFFLWDKINVFPLDSIIDTELLLLLLLQRGTHHSSYSAALLWTQQQQRRRQQEGYEEVILPPDCSRIHEHWGAAAAVKRLTWALSTQTRLFTRRTALLFLCVSAAASRTETSRAIRGSMSDAVSCRPLQYHGRPEGWDECSYR